MSSEQLPIPSFEEFVAVVSSTRDLPEGYESIPGETLARYFAQLFTDATDLLRDVSSDQVASMIRLIHGATSSYWHDIRDDSVPRELQINAVRALSPFYRDFLDHRCDQYGKSPARNTNSFDCLDGTVYMMWDMDCIEGAAMFPGEEHLVDPIFEALQTAVRCKTVACQISGLHGLGHLARYHQQRVEGIVDAYLERGNIAAPWLKGYAKDARKGAVL